MNEVKTIELRTPIEVALDIDSEGMTTARKLYNFLGLAQGQFSRWAKSNITDNEFATENEDYWRFDIDVETPTGGIVKRDDYKLTAHFAKKLSVKGNSEKAEEAREYFTTVEERVKQKAIDVSQLSPQLRLMNMLVESMNKAEIEQKKQAEQIAKVEQAVNSIKEDMTELKDNTPLYGCEIDEVKQHVNRKGVIVLGGKDSEAYKDGSIRSSVYSDIYKQLKREFGCVTTYKSIRRKYIDNVHKFIDDYALPMALAEQVKEANAQISMSF